MAKSNSAQPPQGGDTMAKVSRRQARLEEEKLGVLALLLEISLLTHKLCGKPDVGAHEIAARAQQPPAKRRRRK